MATFSGLHLRRRLRAVVTMIAGAVPDDAAEARAVYRTAYDCGDDEPIAELMRQVLDEVTYQKRARDATDRALTDAAEESYNLRTELADVDEALYAALDIRPDSLQAATMYAPGGVRRLAAERDEAVALISTLRGELAAAVDERDKALDLAREAVAGEAAMREERDSIARLASQRTNLAFMDGYRWGYRSASGDDPETRAVHDACDKWIESGPSLGGSLPKRKRTKEERDDGFPHRVGDQWVLQTLRASGRSMTSREIATEIDSDMIPYYMRWVSDLARAGYLTVAKGPGGVRVYSLKEGA